MRQVHIWEDDIHNLLLEYLFYDCFTQIKRHTLSWEDVMSKLFSECLLYERVIIQTPRHIKT